ncbi:MAG TPA: leucine--tRNA ligase [Candidatus Dormibacteraeota bacterium]|nr:leucine--tRNA ligase [Candidatus Dormibacteraeota bacterium]
MAPAYDPASVEARWRRRWTETGLHAAALETAPRPYYNLMMFPYPSAEGLHVGNMYAFTGADIHGRFRSLQGEDVFEPIGFDAFGIHSENFAIRVGAHPRLLVAKNIERFRTQLARLGARFDWSKAVETTDPRYYRWTQWIFLELWRAGLAYRARRSVKWCPQDLTVLADEQVLADGSCERCGTAVEEREMEQWFLRITDFAERLLANLDTLDWSETTKQAQRNWIGRSEGAHIDFPVADGPPLRVFTTRPDTLFGATFMVLAPDHPRTQELAAPAQRAAVAAYAAEAARRRVAGTHADPGAALGVALGTSARHPLTDQPLPLFTAEYVLSGYGTGAIMAVPGHDQRDHAFATAFGLPVVEVVAGGTDLGQAAHTGAGVLVNSGEFTGLQAPDPARAAVVAALRQRGLGEARVTYKLRDWGISRQRYWGPPIPAIHCPQCGPVPVPEADLPVLLPDIEAFRPLGTGSSPLAQDPDFVHTTCPQCGGAARRETDVSDTFLDSAWYFLRYPSADCDDVAFDAERTRRWLPVDTYIGGNEHAVLHLLYSRFVTMALHDLGWLDFEEPFTRFRAHGMIVAEGAKMSKSRGNVVNPDDYLDRYGTDAFRLYLMFMGPYEQGGDFRDRSINGPVRFLQQCFGLLDRLAPPGSPEPPALARLRHRCIRQVTEDTPQLKYNTAIAAMMTFVKALREQAGPVPAEALRTLAQLLAPYAPHAAEELWERLGGPYSVHQKLWPTYDPGMLQATTVTVIVAVNGRKRDQLLVPPDTAPAELERLALAQPRLQRWLDGRAPTRVVVIPGRQVNVVVPES